jgi:uncharacterized protein (DUF362 family)/Pyruvate/2-oxoacid:ferredoxin oxidoreductase delta subunit
MATVVIRKSSYDYNTLRPAFFELMDTIGGSLITPDTRVLIKPNLLSPATPQQAVLTHPHIVKAAVEYVLHRGAHPRVSDSPAMGSFAKILKISGIGDAVKESDVICKEFEISASIDIGEPFRTIEIAEDAINADIVINLPKLKTHSQMLLTLGVKNMFGCIIGYRKPEWHLRTGVNRALFAKLLVLIYQRIKPSFTILDGILAMEGEGPGSGGIPRELGVLIGSRDAHAVDSTVCRMLRLDPERLLTVKIARDMGLIDDKIEIVGHLPKITDFKFPVVVPLVYGPGILHGFIRKHLLQRPVCDNNTCRACEECINICPAGAISLPAKMIRFDYNRCIRCYCCIEVCPYGALHASESFAGGFVRRAIARYF